MQYCDEGIVLHSFKYGDNQLIIHILTQGNGRKSFITRFRAKSPRGIFQPLSLVEFTAVGGRELDKLQQADFAVPLSAIPFDIVKSTIALFIAEFLYRVVGEQGVDRPLYDFSKNSVIALDLMEGELANFHLHFAVRLLYYLGFAPENRYRTGDWYDIRSGQFCAAEPTHNQKFKPETAALLHEFTNLQTAHICTVKLSRGQRSAFLESIMELYAHHTDAVYRVNSIAILREIF